MTPRMIKLKQTFQRSLKTIVERERRGQDDERRKSRRNPVQLRHLAGAARGESPPHRPLSLHRAGDVAVGGVGPRREAQYAAYRPSRSQEDPTSTPAAPTAQLAFDFLKAA